MNFLDLVIFKDEGQLLTIFFFKSSDKNGHIPTDSCHHPNWLEAIPKGQGQCIRRNCSCLEDSKSQANILKDWFIEKGDDSRCLDKELLDVLLNRK